MLKIIVVLIALLPISLIIFCHPKKHLSTKNLPNNLMQELLNVF